MTLHRANWLVLIDRTVCFRFMRSGIMLSRQSAKFQKTMLRNRFSGDQMLMKDTLPMVYSGPCLSTFRAVTIDLTSCTLCTELKVNKCTFTLIGGILACSHDRTVCFRFMRSGIMLSRYSICRCLFNSMSKNFLQS